MKRIATVAILSLVFSPGLLQGDTYPRQSGVDAVHYVFRLTLLVDDSNEIRGDATVNIKFTADDVSEIFLDLTSRTSDGKGMLVTAVSSGGEPQEFTHQSDRLRIPLKTPSKAGQPLLLTVQYHGIPADGLRLIPNMHGDRTAFSENWPNKARQWLPMIDHPYDKATGEFIVTTASPYQVVSNGALVEELDLGDGVRRTHWKQSVPIASWLYAIGVARFAVHHASFVNGIPLESWVFPQDREKGYATFELPARQAIEFFSEHIGPYSYAKLANVEAAGISGGTEHATAIFYGERGVNAGRAPVVHEVAHQWWGNAVTERDWDDVWLSEGFATYFTLLYAEHFEGRDAFVEGLRRSRASVVQLEQRMPDTPVIHRNLADMRRVLNQLVYQKGGWTLHMLRRLIGDEAFWNGIREYYRRYQNQNASTDEFRNVMEHASGKDLAWFFAQWLTRSGVPKLTGTWRYDSSLKQVHVVLVQVQTAAPYRLPIEVGIVQTPGALPRVERAEVNDRTSTLTFAAEREPADVVLDPGTWILMEDPEFKKR